jgi:ectoine hydroxylase-related dioxygenase (phytanoyl-CoA dioxygenase family)
MPHLTPDQLAEYERDGVVRLRAFLSADEVAAVRAELERFVREDLDALPADARTLEADGRTVRNLWRLEQHNAFVRALGERADLRALVAPLVRGEPVLAAVETFNKPALIGSGVPWHQDNAYFCQTPPDMLTVWIAIDPVTEANGRLVGVLTNRDVRFATNPHQKIRELMTHAGRRHREQVGPDHRRGTVRVGDPA